MNMNRKTGNFEWGATDTHSDSLCVPVEYHNLWNNLEISTEISCVGFEPPHQHDNNLGQNMSW